VFAAELVAPPASTATVAIGDGAACIGAACVGAAAGVDAPVREPAAASGAADGAPDDEAPGDEAPAIAALFAAPPPPPPPPAPPPADPPGADVSDEPGVRLAGVAEMGGVGLSSLASDSPSEISLSIVAPSAAISCSSAKPPANACSVAVACERNISAVMVAAPGSGAPPM
jgi:hypothetical protein